MGKIVRDHEQLARILRVFRTQGKSVVFTNGCFDLLHVGHIRALQDAASRGHYLVVGLNSDASVAQLKGTDRPIQPEDERAEIIAAIEGVDYVTVFDGETTDDILRLLRPSAVAKGPEYTRKTLPEADTLDEIDAELLTVGDPKKHSTRDLIAAIAAGKSGARTRRKGAAKPKAKAAPKAKAKKPTAAKGSKKAAAKKAASKKPATKKAASKKSTAKKTAGSRRRAAAAR